ncbi:diguanylate phosphodiesterase [Listeria fleischmannii 1991]|uniref:EAL domain-containing protein n=2 Tax=Listeria fleischmannii TaxID=1069827 RepID=A0A2X3JBF3_9LIST|nr:hypothetical protein [Listeria fleischmannii]EMG26774.1 diguanylate phosphodiesterase [Listeria fleischmannii subsp. fleischmannii LU2006-1]KMT61429.1 diguanylate phosphodiesterase [Listeria fleischmannii 1991]SQC70409.1 Uncharacterised protein [Listeria fleischmannii subsp. fleischmannii]
MLRQYQILSNKVLGEIKRIEVNIVKEERGKFMPIGQANLEEFSMSVKKLEFFNWIVEELHLITNLSNTRHLVIRINFGELTSPILLKLLEYLKKEKNLFHIELQIRDSYQFWVDEKSHFSLVEKKAFILGKLRSLKNLGYTIVAENMGNGIYSLENSNYYIHYIDVIQLQVESDKLCELKPFIIAWEQYSLIHNTKMRIEYLGLKTKINCVVTN